MKNFDRRMVKKIVKGGYVFDGKVSVFLTKNFNNIFKIWLTANLVTRAKRCSEKDKIPLSIYIEKIKKIEYLEKNYFTTFIKSHIEVFKEKFRIYVAIIMI